jgi:hypothetical protein
VESKNRKVAQWLLSLSFSFSFFLGTKICIVSKLRIKKVLQMFDFVAFLLPNFYFYFSKMEIIIFSSLSSQK